LGKRCSRSGLPSARDEYLAKSMEKTNVFSGKGPREDAPPPGGAKTSEERKTGGKMGEGRKGGRDVTWGTDWGV